MENREQTLESRLLLATADWLTVLLLAAGLLFPCLSAYGISGQYGFDLGGVLAFCVFGALAVTAIFSWRRWYWTVLGLLAAGGLIFWRLWVHMEKDWHRVREPGLADLIEKSPEALILLYALAVLALGWTVVCARAWWLAAALVILPVLPAIQSGALPSWWAMLAGFAGWGSMLLTGLFSRKDLGSLGRARLVSLGGMAALTLLLVMALPMEGYDRPQWATDMRNDMIRGVNRQLSRFFTQEELENSPLAQLGLDLTITGEEAGSGTGGGPNAIEIVDGGRIQRENLLNVGPLRYRQRQIMTLQTDQPDPAGRIYLRGVSFDTYTGSSWENSGLMPDGARPDRLPPLTAPEGRAYTMSIRCTAFSGIWYYPYRFTGGGKMSESGRITGLDSDREDDPDLLPVEEIRSFGRETYQITYVPGGPETGFTPLDGEWAAEELDYRYGLSAFDAVYLDVPWTARESLEPLLPEFWEVPVLADGRLPEQYREPVAAAARTAQFLASAAAYDPETPAMAEGEDFIAHFLEEGRGYCVHFATAGVLLLRMQGVPARYVSGYVADLDARGRSTVLDTGAHAWVEIYLDGYGWYPVEMTPGYTGGDSGVGLEGAAEAPDSGDPEAESTEEEQTTEEEAADEGTESSAPDGPFPDDGAEVPGGEEPEETGVAAFWKVLFGIAVFWAVLCAGYLLALLARRQARMDKDTNRSVLNACGRYQRLRRWGCGEDDELVRLAKKAKFSQHTLTEEERETAWKCLDEDLKQSQVGQPVRRRWLLALLCPIF